MLSINDLPNEILEMIISHLTPYKDLDSCEQICQRWADLVKRKHLRKILRFQQAFKEGNLCWRSWNPGGAWTPVERYSHSATVYKNVMYIFGGASKLLDRFHNDLWALDLSTRTWQKCNSSRHQPYPAPKKDATMVAHENRLIIFGGIRRNWESFHELYVFNLLEKVWSCPTKTLPQPPQMNGHTATVHGRFMVVFGGVTRSNLFSLYFNDVWTLDLDNFTWKCQETSINRPSRRFDHHQVRIDDENLLIIGGCSEIFERECLDVWLLTITSPVWTWREIQMRNRHCGPYSMQHLNNSTCVFDKKLIFLEHTKIDPEIFICDLSHVLDPIDPFAEWLKIPEEWRSLGAPSDVGFRNCSLVLGNAEFICFGGIHNDLPSNYLHFINAPFRSVK
ncbi:uncharacterized protein DMENIID0001_165360 [Sergentomyia squamirostris]